MRKIIIIIILCLLLIGSGFIFVKGNQKVNIYGVKDISSKNDEIDKKNEELSNLVLHLKTVKIISRKQQII